MAKPIISFFLILLFALSCKTKSSNEENDDSSRPELVPELNSEGNTSENLVPVKPENLDKIEIIVPPTTTTDSTTQKVAETTTSVTPPAPSTTENPTPSDASSENPEIQKAPESPAPSAQTLNEDPEQTVQNTDDSSSKDSKQNLDSTSSAPNISAIAGATSAAFASAALLGLIFFVNKKHIQTGEKKLNPVQIEEKKISPFKDSDYFHLQPGKKPQAAYYKHENIEEIRYRADSSAKSISIPLTSMELTQAEEFMKQATFIGSTTYGFMRPFPIDQAVIWRGGMRVDKFKDIPQGKTHEFQTSNGIQIIATNMDGHNVLLTIFNPHQRRKGYSIISQNSKYHVQLSNGERHSIEGIFDVSNIDPREIWQFMPLHRGESFLLLNAGTWFPRDTMKKQFDYNGLLITLLPDNHVLITQTKDSYQKIGSFDPTRARIQYDGHKPYISIDNPNHEEVKVYISKKDLNTVVAIEDKAAFSLRLRELQVGQAFILLDGVERFSYISNFKVGAKQRYELSGIELLNLDGKNVLIRQYKGMPTEAIHFQIQPN